ncbi:MAG: CDP-alcohol phosphatidyltransferase family protein [Anaerolineae bacterium]|nr:CDP-alcohol phosphatidyltransferase family protein [Anaerolineae bacterium]
MGKVTSEHKFTDFSDYARPIGDWLARALVATPATPIHVSIAFIIAGCAAGGLYLVGTYPAQIAAGLLLLVKSAIDAADGSLARLRQRPSRIGRFLDAIGDFVVDGVVILAIGVAEMRASGDASAFWIAVLALASVTWQVSVFNYFYVSYRLATKGDTTSQIDEAAADNYPWDDPATVRRLLAIYTFLYAWQDKLALAIDRRVLGSDQPALASKTFMTLTSVLGLGTALLILCLFSLIGRPFWALYVFVIPFNLYWIALFLARRFMNRT